MMDVILFGGSFRPFGNHHFRILIELLIRYLNAMVVIVPCGPRKDKESEKIPKKLLLKMMLIAFRPFKKMDVKLDIRDIATDSFRPTHILDEEYSKGGKNVWHAIGTDIIKGGAKGESEIHKKWARREQDFNELKFIVFARPGEDISMEDLPPNSKFIRLNVIGSSTEIRLRCRAGLPFQHLVSSEMWKFIVDNYLFGYKSVNKNDSYILSEEKI